MLKLRDFLCYHNYMELIITEPSTVAAFCKYGKITFNNETITFPSKDAIKDKLITIDRGADAERRWWSDGIATFVSIHTTQDGKTIVMDFDDAMRVANSLAPQKPDRGHINKWTPKGLLD